MGANNDAYLNFNSQGGVTLPVVNSGEGLYRMVLTGVTGFQLVGANNSFVIGQPGEVHLLDCVHLLFDGLPIQLGVNLGTLVFNQVSTGSLSLFRLL